MIRRRRRRSPSVATSLMTIFTFVLSLPLAAPASAAPATALASAVTPQPTVAPTPMAAVAGAAAASGGVYGNAAGVSVVKVRDGTWRAFAIGANGQIYQQIKRATWSAPESLGGSFKAGPAAVYRAGDHRFDVFAVSTGGVVLQRIFSGGRWGGWISTGVTGFAGQLSAVRDSSGSMHLFGVGAGRHVVQNVYVGGRGWTGTRELGGSVRGNVALVYWAPEHRFDLFVVGDDQRVWQKTYLGRWSGWTALSKAGFAGGITAVRTDSRQWWVIGVGTNRQLYEISYRDRHWSSPARLGGSAIGSPGAFWSGQAGSLMVTGTDRRLYERPVSRPCCSWVRVAGTVYPPVGAPRPPAPTRVTLAKTLLARWGGRLTGLPGVRSDLQITAAGGAIRNSSSCNRSVYLDARMLASIVKATGKYQVFVNNMVTGHGCGSGFHPKGKAVDFNTVIDPATGRRTNWHSYESGDNRALDREFLSYAASAITSGGGAGQVNCPGSATAPVPAGMLRFSDYCNHQHLDSR